MNSESLIEKLEAKLLRGPPEVLGDIDSAIWCAGYDEGIKDAVVIVRQHPADTARGASSAEDGDAANRKEAVGSGRDSMLDPDMPAQEIRLHMGEMTPQEERTARAAIRWANVVGQGSFLNYKLAYQYGVTDGELRGESAEAENIATVPVKLPWVNKMANVRYKGDAQILDVELIE